MGGLGRVWSEEDIDLFISLWPNTPMLDLIKTFGRTYPSLYDKAKKLGIRKKRPKDRAGNPRIGDLSILLNGSNESWYWLGFLCADGHITRSQQLTISQKDPEPLEKFAKYIKGSVKPTYSKGVLTGHRVVIMQPDIVLRIRELLGYMDNKTHNPPTKLLDLHGDKLLSFFVGFVDGDGHIKHTIKKKHSVALKIEIHSSWLNVLALLGERLIYDLGFEGVVSKVKLTKRGYALLSWTSPILLQRLLSSILRLNVPLMQRKWSKLYYLEGNLCL